MIHTQTFTLQYEAVSTWDNRVNPYPEYAGNLTDKFLETFSDRGQVMTIFRYDPLIDKTTLCNQSRLLSDLNKADYERWIDPTDSDFWIIPDDPYSDNVGEIKRKVFVGFRELDFPYPLAWGSPDLDHNDSMRILLPPDLYLHRIYQRWGQVVNGQGELYQRTVYVLLFDGLRYSIENLKPRFVDQGEFVMWAADLRLIFQPGNSQLSGWWPWSALYRDGSDVIEHYIQSKPASAQNYNVTYNASNQS